MIKDYLKKQLRKNHQFKKGTNAEQVTTYHDANVLMKGNSLISSTPAMIALGSLIIVSILIISNYLTSCVFNSFLHFPQLLKGEIASSVLFGIKNAFLINRHIPFFVYVVMILVSVLTAIAVLTKIRIAYKDLNVGQDGTDRFATEKEIKEQYVCIDEKNTPFEGWGGLPVYRIQEKVFIDTDFTNTLVIGTTRSGKGEAFIRLMIEIISRAKSQASMIIADPKIEQYPAAKKSLEERGYKVYLMNFLEPLSGVKWNLLTEVVDSYKHGDYDDAEMICRALACSVYSNPSQANESGEFFTDTSRDCFTAMALALVIDCLEADEKINAKRYLQWKKKNMAFEALSEKQKQDYLTSLLDKLKKRNFDWLQQPYIPTCETFTRSTENEKKINMYSLFFLFSKLAAIVPDKKNNPDRTALDIFFLQRSDFDRAKLKYLSIQIAGARTKSNIFSSYLTKLSVFTLQANAVMTAKSDFNIADIGFGDKPIAVFLGLPDYDTSNHFVATSFIRQVYYVLSKKAVQTRGGCCPRRVHEILDEVGNIPRIDMLSSQLTMGLSRGIITHLFVQDDEQLNILYGNEANPIKNNCGNQVLLTTADLDTAKNFSEALGNQTITDISRLGRKFSLRKTYTEMKKQRPLLNSNELMKMQIGEFAMRRIMKRADLKGNKITSDPIHVHGQNSFKYAYEFLDDFYEKDMIYQDFVEKDVAQQDMSELCYDADKWIRENLSTQMDEDISLFENENRYIQFLPCFKQLVEVLSETEFDLDVIMDEYELVYQLQKLLNAKKIEKTVFDKSINILTRM